MGDATLTRAALSYESGEPVQAGDRIRYHGEAGYVDFVVTEKSGDPSLDWFVEQYPGGEMMILAETFGRVFLGVDDFDDLLEFVARSTDGA
jgi:hypothetical protein